VWGDHYETLAICRTLELARAVFAAAIAERPASRFMIRNRIRVVKRYPEGNQRRAAAAPANSESI
jgi:hypothetical protein